MVWVCDGLTSSLIRYDFEQPHGPASLDHSLANVRGYPEVKLTRVPGVPGHMVVDAETRTLYVADTGGGRVVAVVRVGTFHHVIIVRQNTSNRR